MAHARLLATVLSLNTWCLVLVAGPLTGERDAHGAARETRTTSARSPRARRTNEATNGARRTHELTKDAAVGTKDAPTRERDGASDKRPGARGSEKSAAKSAPDGNSNTKSAAVDARASAAPDPGRSADPAPARSGDATSSRGAQPSASAGADPAPIRVTDLAPSRSTDALQGRSADAPQGRNGEVSRGGEPAQRSADFRGGVAKVPSEATGEPTSATSATHAVVVALEGPVFDGGDVPRAAAALDRLKAAFGRCAAVENALTKGEATLELRFLVRAPGRAEGVDASKVRGVSSDVVRCMMSTLARSYIGAPSDDPVGVAVTVRIKRPEAANN